MADRLASRRFHTGKFSDEQMQRQAQDASADLNALRDSLERFLGMLGGAEVTGLLRNVSFTAFSPVVLNHNLGRPIRGYIVVRSRGATPGWVVGESGNTVPDPNNQISLTTTSNATQDIFFF